jgi:hypothetical protein
VSFAEGPIVASASEAFAQREVVGGDVLFASRETEATEKWGKVEPVKGDGK